MSDLGTISILLFGFHLKQRQVQGIHGGDDAMDGNHLSRLHVLRPFVPVPTALQFDVSLAGGPLLWVAVISVLGGAIGACYNLCIFRIHRLRKRAFASAFARRHRCALLPFALH